MTVSPDAVIALAGGNYVIVPANLVVAGFAYGAGVYANVGTFPNPTYVTTTSAFLVGGTTWQIIFDQWISPLGVTGDQEPNILWRSTSTMLWYPLTFLDQPGNEQINFDATATPNDFDSAVIIDQPLTIAATNTDRFRTGPPFPA